MQHQPINPALPQPLNTSGHIQTPLVGMRILDDRIAGLLRCTDHAPGLTPEEPLVTVRQYKTDQMSPLSQLTGSDPVHRIMMLPGVLENTIPGSIPNASPP